MASMHFFDPDATDYLHAADAYPDALKAQLTDAEVADTSIRLHHGLPGRLQLFEIRLEPGLDISTHAHADDEIIAVVEGELHLGRRVCGPGASIFVPGNTLYGFRAGPEGCRYLNFRAQADSTFFSKEDFVEARRLRMHARHVVLVGAMGTGKSTVGRPLAAALGRQFLDNDELLEQRVGVSAAVVEKRDGIDALHDLEAAVLLDALATPAPAVIAAAASTIERAEVRTAVHRDAFVVWLHVDPSVLAARLPSPTRPFAGRDPARLVADQAAARDDSYAAIAHLAVDTGAETVEASVARIVAAIA